MVSRRTFIKVGLGAGVGAGVLALTPWGRLVQTARAQPARRHIHRHARGMAMARATPLDPNTLRKFVDPLPLPAPLRPIGAQNGLPYFEIAMQQFRQQLHSDLAPTTLWGYDGRYPGPLIEATIGQALRFRWTNEIAGGSFLIPGVFDPNLEGTNMGEPQVRGVVHLHGANVPAISDGHPDAWFTAGFAVKGMDWKTEIYEYPNRQPPALLWYHDHSMGQTRLNIYAGLAGLYLLRDPAEAALATLQGGALPQGAYEIPMLIQDKMFDADGSLLYPVRDPAEVPTGPKHPGPWVPEFFGNVVLVNGKAWPHLEVEPRRYRLRVVNAANASFYNLKLDRGMHFTQIGADHGFLPKPVTRSSVLIAPAERADLIVDFTGMSGNVTLSNDAHQPFPDGDDIDEATTGQIMQFRVTRRLAQADTSTIIAPKLFDAVPTQTAAVLARQASVTRNMALIEFDDENANDEPIIALLNNRLWANGAPTQVKRGALEVWHVINMTEDAHPIHLHQVHFQVLGRQPFDAPRYRKDWVGDRAPATGPDPISPTPYLNGPMTGPEADETGFKDTVRSAPGQVTSIVVRFGDYTGIYPWHCHILDHEDNSMMQRFEVV
jgi:spore coat protein A